MEPNECTPFTAASEVGISCAVDLVPSSTPSSCSSKGGGRTESELLGGSSRNSSGTLDSRARDHEEEDDDEDEHGVVECCELLEANGFWSKFSSRVSWCVKQGIPCKLISGLVLTILGACTVIWTPFNLMMTERINMSPGLPPFDWWQVPPDEVLLRVYIFNITNPEEFMNGTDTKLHLKEIGPIIFREKLTHTNISFHKNGTLSYVAKRTAVYLPEMNTIDLNETITTFNLAVLGAASYLWDASFFTKFAYNLLTRTQNSSPLVKTSLHNYMWNFTDPLLQVGASVLPFLVPVDNLGILRRIYDEFEDSVTVYTGQNYGHDRFFLLDKYHGVESLPGHSESCKDTVINATEGVLYAQFLNKNSTLRYWRKTMCKVTPLTFEKEAYKYGVDAYKFSLPASTYNRTTGLDKDCYSGTPALPDGLSDVSPCYYGFPMAASFPHFLYGDDVLHTYVDGLNRDVQKHESFVIVEPTTGIPLESRARSQSNLIMRKLTGFNKQLEKFSGLVLPMFWAEYNQVGLPFCVAALMYFVVRILPVMQWFITAALFASGAILILNGFGVNVCNRKRHFVKNTVLHFEQEFFLKQS